MIFSIRTLMLNVTYVAAAIAAWSADSEIFIALVTLLFIVLILRSVTCCFIASENRPYWIGNAIFSCGILLTSHYLLIFEAIATYEDYRRHAVYAYATLPTSTLLPPSFPSGTSGTIPPTFNSWSSLPAPVYSGFSFRIPGGYVGVMKAFLVSLVAYLSGTIAGVICMKFCVLPNKVNHQTPVK